MVVLRNRMVYRDPALGPTGVFELPLVNDPSAPLPTAVLPPPVTMFWSAPWPTAVVVFPVMLVLPASAPTNVLSVPALCRKRLPPRVSSPIVPALFVFGRVRIPLRVR